MRKRESRKKRKREREREGEKGKSLTRRERQSNIISLICLQSCYNAIVNLRWHCSTIVKTFTIKRPGNRGLKSFDAKTYLHMTFTRANVNTLSVQQPQDNKMNELGCVLITILKHSHPVSSKNSIISKHSLLIIPYHFITTPIFQLLFSYATH